MHDCKPTLAPVWHNECEFVSSMTRLFRVGDESVYPEAGMLSPIAADHVQNPRRQGPLDGDAKYSVSGCPGACLIVVVLVFSLCACRNSKQSTIPELLGTPLESAQNVYEKTGDNATTSTLWVNRPVETVIGEFETYCKTSGRCQLSKRSSQSATFVMTDNPGIEVIILGGKPLPDGMADPNTFSTDSGIIFSRRK